MRRNRATERENLLAQFLLNAIKLLLNNKKKCQIQFNAKWKFLSVKKDCRSIGSSIPGGNSFLRSSWKLVIIGIERGEKERIKGKDLMG